MVRIAAWLLFLLLAAGQRLGAVENTTNDTYNETAPTNTNITDWLTGWAQPAVEPTGYTYTTGWNYVGIVQGNLSTASGVYLGNGWVITCGHVGPGTFILNGTSYSYIAKSAKGFTFNSDQPDFVVFQVDPVPDLPALPLRMSDPVLNSSKFALVGFGDGGSQTKETWGYNTVNYGINESTSLFSFISNDFWTLNGSTAKYQVVGGDSGGGDFIYNSSASRWELAGLNEAILDNENQQPTGSAFIQLDTYAAQIAEAIQPAPVPEPTMPQWGLILLGCLLGLIAIPSVRGSRCPRGEA